MKSLKYKFIESPVGQLKTVTDDKHLIAILWDNEKPNRVKLDEMVEDKKNLVLLKTEKQLLEYFLRERSHFDVPLKFNGTPFQEDVWNILSQIPYGVTYTYKDIAHKVGKPEAVRAVGAAIGRNPISIIIPCHRVIASNGSLTGFAGGLERKKQLLKLESDY